MARRGRWPVWLLLGLVGACAQQPPHLIKPTSTDDMLYAARSCQDLGKKLGKAYMELAERSQVQLSEDATSENAAHIAALKGKQNVILATMAQKNCPAEA